MAKIDKILQNIDSIKSTGESKLIQSVKTSSEAVYTLLENLLLGLSSSNGTLSLDESSKKFLLSLNDKIYNSLMTSGYKNSVAKFVRSFSEIDANLVDLHQEASGIKVNLSKLSDIQKAEIQNTVDRLLGNSIDVNFVEPVKESLYRHVAHGGSLTDAKKILKKYLISTPENSTKLERYVSQVSMDSISQYEGAMQQKIAEVYELNAVMYVGSVIKDSRAQCKKWVSMGTIRNEDLKKEIDWAYKNGSGMISGTTPETFCIYRGGYNCRHSAIPVLLKNKN